MTLGDQITRVRDLARVATSSLSNQKVMDLLNEGMRQFAKDVRGLQTTGFVTVTPKFYTRTNFAFHLATDSASATVAVTASTRDYASGTLVASDLQTQIASTWASATVTWSPTTFKFTITIPSATSITVSTPSRADYVDATDVIFGGGGAEAASTWTGSFPRRATVESSLPTTFLSMTQNPEWDNLPVYPAPTDLFSAPQYAGTPAYWQVKNKRLRLSPYPTTQKMCQIYYRGLATDYATVSATTTTCPLPTEYHEAPMYYAASVASENEFDSETANRLNARYQAEVNRYILQENNDNPNVRPFTYREWDLKMGSIDALN